MGKQAQPQSTTTRVDVVTPDFGPIPAIYVPIRRPKTAPQRAK
ncbi:MAG TPA: hypothetical protein VGN81_02435 [Pseudonocardiaceae bacterium]|jgi:hypothetical protein